MPKPKKLATKDASASTWADDHPDHQLSGPRPTLDRRQRAALWRRYVWRVVSRPGRGAVRRLSDVYTGETDPRFLRDADALLANLDSVREVDVAELSVTAAVWDQYALDQYYPAEAPSVYDDAIRLYFTVPRLRRGAKFTGGRKADDVAKKIAAFLESQPGAQAPAVLAHLTDLAKREDDVVLAVAPVGLPRALVRLKETGQAAPAPFPGRTVVWQGRDSVPHIMSYPKLRATVKRVRRRLCSAR
jgi:hypothetical protein